VPTISHILYIPGILLIGITLGFVLGAKAARSEAKQNEQRRKR
jgi:proteasome assembly chaperone (PAC2) family protein